MGKKHNVYYKDFIALPKSLWFKCSEWHNLSPTARDVYSYLKAIYNTENNGEIVLYYSSLLKIKGLKSKRRIAKAFKELIDGGWIERPIQKAGGLPHNPNRYTLTWKYDDCHL